MNSKPRRHSRWANAITCAFVLLCSCLASAQTAFQDTGKDQGQASSSRNLSASLVNSMNALDDTYKLGPGDKVSFRVIEDEEPARALTVTDSGEMDVPLIGRFKVSGMTCKTAAYQLKSALQQEYFHQASVILGIDVMGARSNSRGKFYVGGRVRQIGYQNLPVGEVMTVGKAILAAGGFSEYADKRKVKIIRKTNSQGESETKIVDLVEVLEKGKMSKDVVVEADDIITVPERLFNF